MFEKIEALIKNTTCEARKDTDGNVISYRIRPNKGYKLHEITLDRMVFDEETGEETDVKELGYTTAYVTAGASYDFKENVREIYAVKETTK